VGRRVGATAGRVRALFAVASCVATVLASERPAAASTFKVAFFNIQGGKGEPPIGGPSPFADTNNCRDTTQQLNAWGQEFVQPALVEGVRNDPDVIVIGLAEAWACASAEAVQAVLGWKAATSTRNGVAMVAKYGFAGPEVWVQLDTSLNQTPADTKWVVRRPVCIDAACSRSVEIFSAHWGANGLSEAQTYRTQAQQTVPFLESLPATTPRLFMGDLNLWEGTATVCSQVPRNDVLTNLRAAGYVDAWPVVNGAAEGYTGMLNRAGCGSPEGYAWKRIDYVWTKNMTALSMTRFAMVPAGSPAPSDHYGIIAELMVNDTELSIPITTPTPTPSPTPVPAPTTTPSANGANRREIVLYAANAVLLAGRWRITADTTAAGGSRLVNPDAGLVKKEAADANPVDYVELTFEAESGRDYRVWLRAKAAENSYLNDSVYLQFSGTVTAAGVPIYRAGTTSALAMVLEDCSGCGVSGWGWQDEGYGAAVLGPTVRFATTGPQRIRIQRREDGISIDQIVISSEKYLVNAPGAVTQDVTILPPS
jgi:endonuclease/exonuclease/phosphatase family metal-dependent hydrolase